MDNVKRAKDLLAELKSKYGIDPRDIGGAIAGYAINLGISVVQPDMLESVKEQLQEADEPEEISTLLDAADEEGRKALDRRNLASDLGWTLANLIRNVVVAQVMKLAGGRS